MKENCVNLKKIIVSTFFNLFLFCSDFVYLIFFAVEKFFEKFVVDLFGNELEIHLELS